MSKSSEQHQSNSRLGALGESLVQTFLLEYCDWCYTTQDKHNTTQNYFTFTNKQITDTFEIDTLQETLEELSSVPKINKL
jgi:hypothetical protein